MASRAVKPPSRSRSAAGSKAGTSLQGIGGADWQVPQSGAPPLPEGPPPPLPGVGKGSASVLPGDKFDLPTISPSPSREASKRGGKSKPPLPMETPPKVNPYSAAYDSDKSDTVPALNLPRGCGDGEVQIHVATWNMNATSPENIPETLLRRQTTGSSDIYVFGTQESGPLLEWESALETAIGAASTDRSAQYVKVASDSLWDVNILVYARKSLSISSVRTGSVATGIGNVLGNKGGVGVGLVVNNTTRLLFITAHFAAHDEKVEDRNADFARISTDLFGLPGGDVTGEYDLTVWCGDLNYRVDSNRKAADLMIQNQMWEVMRANDQLGRERTKGRVFKGFDEGAINFAPTYKFDNGTDVYDTSLKARVPSWTDRIMWKCNTSTHRNSTKLVLYDSVPDMKSSDHRPVVATMHVKLLPEGSSGGNKAGDVKSSACAVQ